jgi:competence protein ComEC
MNMGKSSIKKDSVIKLFICCLVVFTAFYVLAQFYHRPNIRPPDGEIWLHFIDVGQGDCILIQSADNAVLIDAGTVSASRAITTYLDNLGITSLDYVVATHPHSDHIGGMPAVINRYSISEFWMPDVVHTTHIFEDMLDALEANNMQITTVQAGDILRAGIIEMTVVAPNRSFYQNLNNYSIVLHMKYGNTAMLFTGDAEALSENEIIADWDIKSDIIKVGHHGSRTSSSHRFLSETAASVAVITVGAGNRFGHPHGEVVDRLNEMGMVIKRTDELGTIVLITDGENIYAK